MTNRPLLHRLIDNDQLNYLLTNRLIPRRAMTRLVGWLSRNEHPLVSRASIAVWRRFSDLDLSETKFQTFRSLRDCFIRELRDGARPIDPRPEIFTSPCDAIVGSTGRVDDGVLVQVKGRTYALAELLRDEALVTQFRNGTYVTLRLTASMYHRFHAPHRCRVEQVAHIWGDAWNVNPPTLARVDRVFCRNERAVLNLRLADSGQPFLLVPVAAILVAGLHLNFIDMPEDRAHQQPWRRPSDATFEKGAEMGWFEHGSTIIVIAPGGFALTDRCVEGQLIRMGEPLLVVA